MGLAVFTVGGSSMFGFGMVTGCQSQLAILILLNHIARFRGNELIGIQFHALAGNDESTRIIHIYTPSGAICGHCIQSEGFIGRFDADISLTTTLNVGGAGDGHSTFSTNINRSAQI